jgi:hypothetical protein
VSNRTIDEIENEKDFFENVDQNRKTFIKSPYLRPKGPSPTVSIPTPDDSSETDSV